MGSTFETVCHRAADVPANTLHWFMSLNHEEWLITLVVVCACGFLSLLGFQSR